MKSEIVSFVHSTIEKETDLLNHVSKEIWSHPELRYEEKFAHDILTGVLKDKGFNVHSHYVLPTAFRAEFASSEPGPTVAVICEYDALPDVGHACGHNLIAESGLAAALAIKSAIDADSTIPGKVVVLGTPAEEGGGGKIDLIKAGAFEDIDIALMVHPSRDDHLYPPFVAIGRVNATFIGKEAHASGFPWDGINALDAAVASYNNVAFLRQHIKPTCRIHGIISNGGVIPNVIPGISEVQYFYRAATSADLESLRKKVESCILSAAAATGCEVKLSYEADKSYDSLMTNKILAELYKKYAALMGVNFQDGNPKVIPFMASSDMGNVSHVVPSIHPTYSIGAAAPNHSRGFTDASGSPEAQGPTLIAGKSMALLAIEVMCNPKILEAVKQQFQDDLLEDSAQV